MQRRDFFKTLALATAAVAMGRFLPSMEVGASGSIVALLPEGAQYSAALAELARTLSYEGEWQEEPLQTGLGADLLLLSDGLVLNPQLDFSQAALKFRATLQGKEATRMLRLRPAISQAKKPTALRVLGPSAEKIYAMDQNKEIRLETALGVARCHLSPQGVEMVQATCRHEHCCHMGRIQAAGERIVCAPAALILELC
jgi:hypothetical protein